MLDVLDSLLEEFAKSANLPELKTDANNTCLIKFKTGLKVQIEVDKTGDNLLIGSNLGNIPPGRYRESVFKEALKQNGQKNPFGIFSYSKKADQLFYYILLPLKDLTGQKIDAIFTPFSQKAEQWMLAISRGEPAPTTATSARSMGSGMFGL